MRHICLVKVEFYQSLRRDAHRLNSFASSEKTLFSKPIKEAFSVFESSTELLRQPACTCRSKEDPMAQWQHDVRVFAFVALLVCLSIGSVAYRLRIQAPEAGSILAEPLSAFALVSIYGLLLLVENFDPAVA